MIIRAFKKLRDIGFENEGQIYCEVHLTAGNKEILFKGGSYEEKVTYRYGTKTGMWLVFELQKYA